MTARPLMTTVSTKGQVILPKAIRDLKTWTPGTRLTVEETPDGVLLRPAPLFPATQVEDVAGMLAWEGPPASIEDMDQAISQEVARRHDRGRY